MLYKALEWFLLIAACFPFLYYLFAIWCARRFFLLQRSSSEPTGFTPPVSILKPVRGLDADAYENFASFCRQDYPAYEVLFCVDTREDPAVPVIEKLIRDYPERKIALLVGAEPLGTSSKVNKLCRLAKEARHDLLVISDSDIRVCPDYLRRVAAPFADPQVGGVTCFYLGIAELRWGAELEAIAATSDFFAGVLVARQIEGIRFMLGATMATTKTRLAEIGGFEALVDHFVDDYELGNRIATRDWRIEVARGTVWTHYPAMTLRGFLEHRLRWALAVRHARPDRYLGMLATFGLPWALAAAAVAPSAGIAVTYLGTYLALRFAMAWTVGLWGLRDPLLRRKWWLVPPSDAVWFPVWLASLFWNRINWRGREFYVRRGRLIPVTPPISSSEDRD